MEPTPADKVFFDSPKLPPLTVRILPSGRATRLAIERAVGNESSSTYEPEMSGVSLTHDVDAW